MEEVKWLNERGMKSGKKAGKTHLEPSKLHITRSAVNLLLCTHLFAIASSHMPSEDDEVFSSDEVPVDSEGEERKGELKTLG